MDIQHPVHAKAVREPVTEMLDASGQRLCDALLLRALERANTALPPLVPALLGTVCVGADHIIRNPALTFTKGEPAINVYVEGGLFTAHEDNQALTVLLALSDAGAFTGGGTAFWPAGRGDEGGRATQNAGDPSLKLVPSAGDAILFAGSVRHSGLAVASGERVVLVASLSPAPMLQRLIGRVIPGLFT